MLQCAALHCLTRVYTDNTLMTFINEVNQKNLHDLANCYARLTRCGCFAQAALGRIRHILQSACWQIMGTCCQRCERTLSSAS